MLIIITFINPLLNRITFLNYLILQLDVIEKNKTLLSRNYYLFSIINILIFSSILFLGIYGFAPNELQDSNEITKFISQGKIKELEKNIKCLKKIS